MSTQILNTSSSAAGRPSRRTRNQIIRRLARKLSAHQDSRRNGCIREVRQKLAEVGHIWWWHMDARLSHDGGQFVTKYFRGY